VTLPGRLRRFLHLERPRGPDDDGPAPAARGDRFAALERAPAHPAARATGAATGRFGPEREATLELAEKEEGARPFQRCLRCGRDHGLFETACSGCGARLDTPEQNEFNERLWAERQAEEARLAAEAAESAARAAREEEELAKLRREMGIELARQVGERERRRLGLGSGARGPLGLAVLQALPGRWRPPVVAAAAVAWLLVVVLGLARRSPSVVFLAVIAAIALVVPRRGGPGRFGGFDPWP
jgi:hypothetical protein